MILRLILSIFLNSRCWNPILLDVLKCMTLEMSNYQNWMKICQKMQNSYDSNQLYVISVVYFRISVKIFISCLTIWHFICFELDKMCGNDATVQAKLLIDTVYIYVYIFTICTKKIRLFWTIYLRVFVEFVLFFFFALLSSPSFAVILC